MKNLKTTFFGCLTAVCTSIAASHHDPHGLAAFGVIAFGALTSYFTKDAHPRDDEDDDKWMRKPEHGAPAADDSSAKSGDVGLSAGV
jgi:hypothetical protein